jgi:hypothetical protein
MIVTQYLPMLFSLLTVPVYPGEGLDGAMAIEPEPCIKGGVCASGADPSQAMEKQIEIHLACSKETGSP